MPKADLVSRSFTESLSNYLKLVKNYLADFFRKGGEGVPPFSITEKLQKYLFSFSGGRRVFWAKRFSAKVPPNSAKEKNPLKDSYFWAKKLILALFDQLF